MAAIAIQKQNNLHHPTFFPQNLRNLKPKQKYENKYLNTLYIRQNVRKKYDR